MSAGRIHVGIGGWNYEPWRGVFYPPGLPQARELEYAASHLTAIEINATYYRLQKPDSFARWAGVAAPGFLYAVEGLRYCTNRKDLAEAGEAVERFCAQGLTELGDKLGPILWQFMGTKKFDPDEFSAFLKLLPAKQDGVPLRHALEVRHESFRDPRFLALAREAGAAIVFADSAQQPEFPHVTADFVYARLQQARKNVETGYDERELDGWAEVARQWATGKAPEGLQYVTEDPSPEKPRDTYVFMINGAKLRAPAAAQALLRKLEPATD